jgi:hypothetical protein
MLKRIFEILLSPIWICCLAIVLLILFIIDLVLIIFKYIKNGEWDDPHLTFSLMDRLSKPSKFE